LSDRRAAGMPSECPVTSGGASNLGTVYGWTRKDPFRFGWNLRGPLQGFRRRISASINQDPPRRGIPHVLRPVTRVAAIILGLWRNRPFSSLKTLRLGLRLDTNCMDVSFMMDCRRTLTSLNTTNPLFLWETLSPMGGIACRSVILASKSSAAGGDTRTKC